MTFVLWLLVTCLWPISSAQQVRSLTDMFSYGLNLDTQWPPSLYFSLPSPAIVLGEYISHVQRHKNFIGFDSSIMFKPWTISGLPRYISLLFRSVSQDERPEDTDFADRLVHEHFDKRYENFTSERVLVLTAESEEKEQAQLAIIFGGNMTFAMFQYNYSSSDLRSISEMRIIANSVTLVLVDDRPDFLLTGNTGVEGRWMFRVDLCHYCLAFPRNSGFSYEGNSVCFQGFTGELCTEQKESDCHYIVPGMDDMCLDEAYPPWRSNLNPCESSPCHQGVCIVSSNGYTCTCPPEYTGSRCEIDLRSCLSSPCVMGKCSNKAGADYECTCRDGFTGRNCQYMTGTCQSWTCVNGTCEDSAEGHRCNCDPGYSGPHCEAMVDYCASSPCAHGDCVSHDFVGFTCERCPGYTGILCETMIDYCQSSPCTPGLGTCHPVVGGYICLCIDNVFGVNCQIDQRPPVGSFGPWGSWTACSKHCGTGLRYRYKQCLRSPCLEDNCEMQLCQSMPCPEHSLEKMHTVSLLTTKRMVEFLQTEEKLFQHVISDVNKYCVTYPDKCCSFLPEISTSAGFRPVLKTEHVSQARGYPKNVTIGLNEIGLVVRAPFSSWYMACGLDSYGDNAIFHHKPLTSSVSSGNALPLQQLDFVDKMIYLDGGLLSRIMRQTVIVMNRDQDLCCLSMDPLPSEKPPVRVDTSGIVYALIATGSVVIVLLLILIGLSLQART